MPLLCLGISAPDLAAVDSVVHAAQLQDAVFDRVLQIQAVEYDLSVPVHHPVGAAAYSVRAVLPFEVVLYEERQAALDFLSEVFLPAFPVVQEQSDLFPSAVSCAHEPQGHSTDTGIADYAAPVAALSVGTGFPNTFSGRSAVEQAQVLKNASSYPNRYDAVPIPGPSAVPNAGEHLTASHENMQAAGDSIGPECEGYTEVQNPGLQNSMDRCTKSLHTSNRPDKPSTCRRKRNSWHPCGEHNRPGIPEHEQVVETPAG